MRRYETIAQIFHGQLGWDGGSPFNLNALTRSLGLRIVLLPISELHANGAIAPRLRLVGLAIELEHTWRRWVLAHEIGHLFTGTEAGADAFAAELLLPKRYREGSNLSARFRVPEAIACCLGPAPCPHTRELIAA